MALVLALVFRSRLRLLPLAVALAAVAITFGLMSLLGRVADDGLDRGAAGAARARGRLRDPVPGARGGGGRRRRAGARASRCRRSPRRRSRRRRLPRAAALAGADGARLRRAAGGRHRVRVLPRAQRRARRRSARAARRRGPRRALGALGCAAPASCVDELARARAARCSRRCGGSAARGRAGRAARRARAAAARAADRARARAGRAGRVDSQTEVISDLARARAAGPARRARPRRAAAARPAWRARSTSSSQGEDLTDPKVVAWMRDYQAGLLKRYGYSAKNGCGKAELCPALSLHRPLPRPPSAASSREQVRALLDAVPPYFSQAVITARPQDGDARVRRQADAARRASRRSSTYMRARLDPPRGRDGAGSAGLPVLGGGGQRGAVRRRCGGSARCWPGLLAVGLALLRGLPALGARVGPARADRARHRLVGARAVRAAACR